MFKFDWMSQRLPPTMVLAKKVGFCVGNCELRCPIRNPRGFFVTGKSVRSGIKMGRRHGRGIRGCRHIGRMIVGFRHTVLLRSDISVH